MTMAVKRKTAVTLVAAIIMMAVSFMFMPCTTVFASTIDETSESSQGSGLGDLSISTNGSDITIKGKGLSSDSSTTWNTIFTKYKGVIVGISGIIFLTMIVLLLVFFAKIGASGDNPVARSNAIKGAVVCGIAAALSGSVTTFVGLFWNALKN